MSHALPYMIQVSQLSITVVGGGMVAKKRAQSLIDAGAHIHLVTPRLKGDWDELIRSHNLTWEARKVTDEECFLADWVFLCTNNSVLHDGYKQNKAPRQMVYRCDLAQEGNFYVPASIERGLLSVSVSTAGASPSYTKHIKETLEAVLPSHAAEDLQFLQQARKRILAQKGERQAKLKVLKELASKDRLRDPNREEWLNEACALVEKERR
ncbi:precorrin-2 dehydrogenase/sirohydrochlorin ferrochelatase family protein [Shouchella lehensis]|uniref:precorrin-2 dehydrogenase n=1 Tax=Shouchella lehensis G1 TaxID=1246626 RepID=A0A060LQ07_9BACI|nr:bifunctional precorrin-2 dehydrogenase/sirohydrochlorin ferrochelatase [Shouchella lehensis]AIC93406.1 siroheme synthase [Shouchella lehensis G1]